MSIEDSNAASAAPPAEPEPTQKKAVWNAVLAALASSRQAPPLNAVPREGPLPLSFSQQRLWILHQYDPDNDAYIEYFAFRISGVLDVGVLDRCLSGIVRRHEILRTSYTVNDSGEPAQICHAPYDCAVELVDLQDKPQAEREALALHLAGEATRERVDLSSCLALRAKLFRLDTLDHLLLLKIHHIAIDGWSWGVVFHDLETLYQGISAGSQPDLPELPIQYADFAVWQREWVEKTVLPRQLKYWTQKLADVPVLEMPTDRPRPPVQSLKGALHRFRVSRDLLDSLKALGDCEGATLFMVLLSVFNVLLSKYSGQEDIAVGSPIAGRNRTEVDALIGCFVNTVVLRTDLSDNPTFRELLRRVRETALQAYAHQDMPFDRLVEELQPERDVSRPPIFQVMFTLHNSPGKLPQLPNATVTPVDMHSQTAKFDLTLSILETELGLQASLEYNIDLFDSRTIERMVGHFLRLLESATADPDRPISSLRMLSEDELRRILLEWNDTHTECSDDICVHDLIAAQAQRTPDAVAIVHGKSCLTYSELESRANQLARYLKRLGVGRGDHIGLFIDPSPEAIVGILAALKVGAAYVPLDSTYPQERLALMMADSNISLLLTKQHLAGALQGQDRLVVCLDTDWAKVAMESTQLCSGDASLDDKAYVIFTSGSTGRPKGVAVCHRGVSNLLRWFIDEFDICDSDRAFVLTSFGFDLTQKNLFAVLSVGGQLHLSAADGFDPQIVRESIGNARITLLNCTPSHIYPVVDGATEEEWDELISLRCLFLGGESIDFSRLAHWHNRDGFATRIINTYGPTECTDIASFYPLDQPSGCASGAIPIGRPIRNVRLYILDKNLTPVPVGVNGELCIGGIGVGMGYINDPAATADKFVPDPFSDALGQRMYRTGDLCRYLPDGNVEFIGRVDHQVKVRGFRIELGEIESVLSSHKLVKECVVLPSDGQNQKLSAFIVCSGALSSLVLRSYMKKHLPDYMVPSTFILVEQLPYTPNGKVDRKALLSLGGRAISGSDYVPPTSAVEKTIADIWRDVLGVEKVGLRDTFFDLGGHSLLAIKAISQMQKAMNVRVPLRIIFTQHLGQISAACEAQMNGVDANTE